MTKRNVCIVFAVLIVLLTSGSLVTTYLISSALEGHARSCQRTIKDLANRAVQKEVPLQRYLEAVDLAEGIEDYYQAGTVLPGDHPFAEEYEASRQMQLSRIAAALKEATGKDCGTDWEAWKRILSKANASPQGNR